MTRHENENATGPRLPAQKSRIPAFASYEEEAEFWDTHDFTEFADELSPVNARVGKNLSRTLNIRLDDESLDELRKTASQKGVGPTTLARMWILEHLRHPA